MSYNLKELFPYMKQVGEEDDQSDLFKSIKPILYPDQINLNLINPRLLKN